MIIGVCGFGSTGSSAVSDYLLEFDENSTIDGIEAAWAYSIDGLVDLERHLMHPSSRTNDSIIAIYRYKKMIKKLSKSYTKNTRLTKEILTKSTNEFIKAITQVTWKWYIDEEITGVIRKLFANSLMRGRLIPRLEKKLQINVNLYPLTDVQFSVMPSNFYEASRLHVHEIIEGMGGNYNKNIILDQPFSGNNPQVCFPFFENPYAIVVDRDPRDVYIFSKTKLIGKNHFMPTENVENFVKYYRSIRDNQPYKNRKENILRIQFEDMVYNYKDTTKKIREFCNLNNNKDEKTIFDPSLSISNTQLFLRFPRFAKDVKYIEKNLAEYIFDFDGYDKPDLKGKMFYGKSPLNK